MGYMDQFGVAEARKEQRRWRTLLTLLAIVVVAASLFYWFKNCRQEQRVKEFLATLERSDYPGAYAFWGCRVEQPCPNYSYKDFLEDWGPDPPSPIGKLRSYRLGTSHARGSGVEIPVVLNDRVQKKLWVEKSNSTLGFAPPF